MKDVSRRRGRQSLCALIGLGTLIAALTAPVAQARGAAHSNAAPPSGGSISVRENAELHCIDPQKSDITTEYDVLSAVIDPLLIMDSHGHFQPDLATSWSFSPNGLQLTFHLRHGVRFSNGDPMDASDVKFSMDREQSAATKSPTAGDYSAIKTTQVLDKYTVRFILSKPYRPILTQLSLDYAGVLDPKAVAAEGPDKFCQFPVGTGPFMVKSVGPALSTVTEVRNPYHTWETPAANNTGAAYLSQIVFKTIVSDATSTSELLSGGVDVALVTGDQLGRVKGNAAITLHRQLAQGEFYLGFNFAHAPLDVLDVRRGIAEAIDRKQVLQVATNGLGAPAYSPVWTTEQFYDPKSPSYAPQYNVADAQHLLAANHITKPLTLLTFTIPGTSAAAEFVQAQLQQVGIKTSIVLKSVADFIPLAAKGQYDLLILGIFYPDPDINYLLFDSSQATAGGLNFIGHKDPTLDKLLEQGRAEIDATQAAATYDKLQRYIDQNVVVDPLWTPLNVNGTRARVGGWHTDPGGDVFYQDLYVTK